MRTRRSSRQDDEYDQYVVGLTHIGGRPRLGSTTRVNRPDGTSVRYVETAAGPRPIPGTDTRER